MATTTAKTRELLPGSLFGLKYVHDARLTSDGTRMAYLTSRTSEESDQEHFELTIARRDNGEQQRVAFSGQVMFPRWSPDGKRLAFVGAVGTTCRVYVCSSAGADAWPVTPEEQQVDGPVDWAPDGSSLVYSAITRAQRQCGQRIRTKLFKSEGLGISGDLCVSIHLLDLKNGVTTALAVGALMAMQPVFSPCGKRILFLASDAKSGFPSLTFGRFKLCSIELKSAVVTEVLGEGWYIAAFAWSPCGERVVIAGDFQSNLPLPSPKLWVVNRDGSGRQCRTEGFTGNLGCRVHHDMPTWSTLAHNYFIVPDRQVAYATVLVGGNTEIWKIRLDGPNDCKPVATGARTCVVLDVNAQAQRLLFAATDLSSPWELYELDLNGGEDRRLTHLNRDVLRTWPKMKMEHLTFRSEDGLPLEGWFLSRADRTGPQPTVLFIHGGPMLATGHAFRFDFHLLAASGFAVLFSNFRGSSGYGEAFDRALSGDWGTKGFPDHMAAADAAVARGLADPKRLGVWGPSHGGFATAWIVGHTHRFRAAVAESSAVNFSTMYYLSDAADLFLYDLGGRPDEIPDVYRSRSPITYAPRCRTPTLLIHGEEDLRCPISEAEQFYRVLRDVGCETELVRIAGMTHVGDSIGPLPARKAQNEALLDWFERHL
jgi:dipeptidyl aminopeptidase/acylaminoacyl peptidase